MPIKNHIELGKVRAMQARLRIVGVPGVGTPRRARRSNLGSIQGNRVPHAELRDHPFGHSGRLVQSARKSVGSGDRTGSTA